MPRRKTPAARATRVECYERICASARLLVENRAEEEPEWLTDARGLAGLEKFYEWLGAALRILDDYCIETPDAMTQRELELQEARAERDHFRDTCAALRLELEGYEMDREEGP